MLESSNMPIGTEFIVTSFPFKVRHSNTCLSLVYRRQSEILKVPDYTKIIEEIII